MLEVKKTKTRERQGYNTPRVKVIGVAARRVICTSPSDVDDPFKDTEEEGI